MKSDGRTKALAKRAFVAYAWLRLAMGMELVAMFVVHLAAVELAALIDWMRTALWIWTVIAVTIVEAVIYVAVEAVRAVEPWSGADEDAAREPLRAIVAIRSTGIRRCFVVTIRTYGRCTYLHSDLRVGFRAGNKEQTSSSKSQRRKGTPRFHTFTSKDWKFTGCNWLYSEVFDIQERVSGRNLYNGAGDD